MDGLITTTGHTSSLLNSLKETLSTTATNKTSAGTSLNQLKKYAHTKVSASLLKPPLKSTLKENGI
jgi:hypothetical protein